MKNVYSQSEINKIIELIKLGVSKEEITIEINRLFNTNRTQNGIICKISALCLEYNIKLKKKVDVEKKRQDDILIEFIKQHPTNITYAVSLASKELNINEDKLKGRYYNYLRYKHCMLTVGSKIGFSNNVKNTKRDEEGNFPPPDMNDVQWLMKHILNLSKADRDKIKLLLE